MIEGYELLKYTPVREKPRGNDEFGDVIDWKTEVVATSKTLKGLLSFVRLKKLNVNTGDYSYTVESIEYEIMHGLKVLNNGESVS